MGRGDAEDHDDEEADKKKKDYSWLTRFDKSWELIEEDESGRLKSLHKDEQIARRRRRQALEPGIRRGIVRYTILAIDISAAMNDSDMKPSRGIAILGMCEEFVREYYDQNPIAHMGIVTTSNGIADVVAPIGSSPKMLCMADRSFRGDASLQNLLRLSSKLLEPTPPYGSKEVIIVFGSLSTTDPGDIITTLDALHQKHIRCSVVGLAAEVYVLSQVAKKTGGDYNVATHEEHFQELISAHLPPNPLPEGETNSSLVQMGFPMLKVMSEPKVFFDVKEGKRTGEIGYECPQCKAWLSDVPTECVLCGLTLITSPHLARSYHHLFPVQAFKEIASEEVSNAMCLACRKRFGLDDLKLRCTICHQVFCLECDIFIHDSLHNCPGCDGLPQARQV